MITTLRRRHTGDVKEINTPYIKDGLIFLLDGIDKGGDNTAWIDLVNGTRFEYVDGVTPDIDNVTFTSGHSQCIGNKELVSNDYNYTIEGVFTADYTNRVKGILEQNKVGVSLVYYYRGNMIICCTAAASNQFPQVAIPSSLQSAGKKLSISGSKTFGYCNGTLSRGGNRYVTRTPMKIGNSYVGKIFCIRVYNRALTEDEVLANYLVDRDRFGV